MIRLFLLTACLAMAQGPAFDVASVKPNTISKGGGEGSRRENVQSSPGSLIMRNVSLRTAITWAYNVQGYQVTGPGWIADERYDIDAKSVSPAPEAQMRLMLRTLLADRFALKVHTSQKEMAALVATVAKGGSKLKPAENPDGPYSMVPGRGQSGTIKSISMEEAAGLLSGPLQMPVVDETGLKGRYDVSIDLTPYIADLQAQKVQAEQDAFIYLFSRLAQEQLGLRIETRKTQVQMVVVDSAERVPTEN
jgi:uncharacterized protein (TIGR03435 family)